MEWRAKVPGLLALVSTSGGKKRMEFMNLDFNAAINIRRSAILKTGPAELTRANFVGQPLKVEFYKEQPKPISLEQSKKARRRLHVGG